MLLASVCHDVTSSLFSSFSVQVHYMITNVLYFTSILDFFATDLVFGNPCGMPSSCELATFSFYLSPLRILVGWTTRSSLGNLLAFYHSLYIYFIFQYLLSLSYLGNCMWLIFSVVDEALEEVVDHVVNEVIKQGYLVKKGHKMKSLKERWFVLKPTYLSYFVNNTCTERKGVITLNTSSAVESVPSKGRYKFTVKCGETKIVYELEAKDQKSRLEWIASIQAAIGTLTSDWKGFQDIS